MSWRRVLLFAELIIFLGFQVTPAWAASQNDITISPYLQQIQVDQSEVTKDFPVEVINRTTEQKTFAVSAVDFGSLDESGGVAFSGTSSNQLSDLHKLAAWITLSTSTLELAPEQKQIITATIRNDSSLAPGGHYGAVIITSTSQAAESNVAINETLSSLVFLTKTGGEQYGLAVDKFTWSHNLLRLPTEVTLPIHNTGNVHAVPRGIVTLIDPRGHEISRGIINAGSTIVLPDTTRPYPVDLNMLKKPSWPGTYHLRIQYRHDGTENFQTTEVTMFYIGRWPLLLLAALVGLGAMVFYGLRYYKKWLRKPKQKTDTKRQKL